ncbi:MAG TPA: PEGA domain-containing protein [Myxococcota bacterium]|jgi:hypothetical protein
MLALAFAVHIAFAAPPSAPVPAAPAPPAAVDDRMRTVILGIKARRGVDDPKLAAALDDVIQGVYAGDVRRIVIGRTDISRVLELEATKQSLGCDTDKCMAEVGQALDAARLVTGSLDRIGDGYMVTLSEIDAKTLEPIARAQDRVKADDAAKLENALVDTVTRLATELVQKSGVTTAAHGVVGNAGSLDISTDPRGAKIVLSGTEMGQTPTKIDNLSTGTQKLRLLRDDYEPIELDVPIYPGGTTKVSAEMRILRAMAEKNLEARRASWRDADQWHTVFGWTKIGVGGVIGLGGVGYALNNGVDKLVAGKGGSGAALVGLIAGGIGAGVLAWGVVDLLNPLAPPVPEWEIERKVTVTPPAGQGTQQVHVIQEKLAPAMR